MTTRIFDTEREWLNARLDGIGSSEASAVIGQSKFSSPWSVWLRKIERRVEESNAELPEMVAAGHYHEPTIAKWLENQPDFAADVSRFAPLWTMRDAGEYAMDWSDETPYLFATTDRGLYDANGERFAVVELKCAWYESAKEWSERVPLGYQVQVQQQMYCTGTKVGYFGALLNGYIFKWFRIDQNEHWMTKKLLPRLEKFWELVKAGTPPPTDAKFATKAALAARYATSNGQQVELPMESQDWAAWRDKAIIDAKDAEMRRDNAENKIKAAMGENEIGVLPQGDRGFSWKANKKGTRLFKDIKLALET